MDDLYRKYNFVSMGFSSSRKKPWREIGFLFDDLIKKGDRVLDIGCGNGRFYGNIAPLADYVGVDRSKELINIARKMNPEGDFRVADALNLPFTDEEFDKIYAIALFHHIPSEYFRRKFLKEIHRTLKSGGITVITVWDIWEKSARRKDVIRQSISNFLRLSNLDIGDVFLEWQGLNNFYFHCFSLRGLTRRLKKAGFKVIRTGKMPSEGGTNLYIVAQKKDL